MSKLVNAKKIIIRNNGIYENKTNKCGTISIGQGTATNIEFINEFLQIEDHEQLDIIKFRNKIQELSDLLGFKIYIHTAQNLDNDLTRVWINPLLTIIPKDNQITYNIHIVWYGGHFELINWDKINDYSEFNKEIYEIIKTCGVDAEEILHCYNYNLCI